MNLKTAFPEYFEKEEELKKEIDKEYYHDIAKITRLELKTLRSTALMMAKNELKFWGQHGNAEVTEELFERFSLLNDFIKYLSEVSE